MLETYYRINEANRIVIVHKDIVPILPDVSYKDELIPKFISPLRL